MSEDLLQEVKNEKPFTSYMLEWKKDLSVKEVKDYVRKFKIVKLHMNNELLWKIMFLLDTANNEFPLHRKYYLLRKEAEKDPFPNDEKKVTKDVLLKFMIYNYLITMNSDVIEKIKFNKMLYIIMRIKLKLRN